MKRRSIGPKHEMIVQPAFIIGTYNEDKSSNFAPITWVSKTCEEGDTYLIVISMYGEKKTRQNVARTGQFSINIQVDEEIDIDARGIDLTQFDPVIYSGNYHSIGEYLGAIGDYYNTDKK